MGFLAQDGFFDFIDKHSPKLTEQQFLELQERQRYEVVRLGEIDRLTYFIYQDRAFSTQELALTAEDVQALVDAKALKKQKAIERAKAVVAMDSGDRHATIQAGFQRKSIDGDVKTYVWQRDGGQCVECGSCQNLEFDHIIPVSMGGSNTARNLQLLCEKCNREKGGNLV